LVVLQILIFAQTAPQPFLAGRHPGFGLPGEIWLGLERGTGELKGMVLAFVLEISAELQDVGVVEWGSVSDDAEGVVVGGGVLHS